MGVDDGALNASWFLYPNPANNELHLEGDFATHDNYIIADLSGRVLQSGVVQSNFVVDVSMLSNGIYFFTLVKENGQIESKRFIKVNSH